MRLKALFWTIIALLATYSAYWYYMAYHAEDYVKERFTAMEGMGFHANYDKISVSGFPYRFIVSLENADLSFDKSGNKVSLKTPVFHITAEPWNFKHIIFVMDTMNMVVSTQAQGDLLSLNPAHTRMSMNTTEGKPFRLSLEMTDVGLTDGVSRAERIGLHIIEGKVIDDGATSTLLEPALATIMVSMDGLRKNGATVISKGAITLVPRGSKVPPFSVEGLSAWRDEGGTLDIVSMTLEGVSEGEKLEAEGSLALDEELRPMGAVTVTSSGNGPIADLIPGNGKRSDSLMIMDGMVLMGNDQLALTHPLLSH